MKTKLWKIYFLILLINAVTAFAWYQFLRYWEIIDLVIFIFSIIGLYAYAWRKEMLTNSFWKIYFPIQLAWNVFYFYMLPLPEKMQTDSELTHYILSTITFIFYIPLYLALYRLAYKKTS